MKEDLANMVTIEWDHSGRQMAALSLTLQVNKILTDNSKLPVFQGGDKKMHYWMNLNSCLKEIFTL